MTAILTYSVLNEIIDNYELKNIIIIRFLKDKLNNIYQNRVKQLLS